MAMKNIKGRKLSRWKAIIVTDSNAGEEKCFDLNENERLINKIKPDRRKQLHQPKKYINIKITKKLLQEHQKLETILNHMISLKYKKEKKSASLISQNDIGMSLITQQNASKQNIKNLYKDLSDQFFFDLDDNNLTQENEIFANDEIDFSNFLL